MLSINTNMLLNRSGCLQAPAGWCGMVFSVRNRGWCFAVVWTLGVNAESLGGGLETSAPGGDSP